MVSQLIWWKTLARDLHLENCRFLHMFSTGFTSLSAILLFLYWSPFSSLCMVFDCISSNIDDVLSINPSTNVFVFGDFNVHHNDWLTYSGGIDRTGELCYNFSISSNLTQMVNFLTYWFPDWFSQSCSFGFIYFFCR